MSSASDLERAASSVRVGDLTPRQCFALRAIRSRSAVLIDGKWRARGAPAPVLNEFALATLLGSGLLRLQTPRVAVLTPAGARMAERLADRALPPWLASA